ncbi:MAG: DUF222 domain-containing protein [Candidatus Nanopelagicales bacterium]
MASTVGSTLTRANEISTTTSVLTPPISTTDLTTATPTSTSVDTTDFSIPHPATDAPTIDESLPSSSYATNHADALLDQVALLVDHAISGTESLSGAEATDKLQRVSELSAKLDAYRIALVTRVDKTEIWRESDPNGTALSYLRRELTLDHREAKADLKLAEGLEDVPELAEALRTGHITRAAADLILSIGQRNPQRQAMFPQYVSLFIQIASNGTLSKLRQVLRAWADQVDPLVTASDESDAFHRRYLHISELGDGVKLDGFFDVTNGMKIMAVLNAAFTAEYKATHKGGEFVGDQDQCERVHDKQTGEGVNTSDESEESCETRKSEFAAVSMSAKQRADAFIKHLVEPALAGDNLPTCGGALPHVLVTVPMDRLQNPQDVNGNHEAIQHSILDDQIEYQSAHIETNNGPGSSLLSTTSAQMLSCDATVQRIILGPNSLPLDIGRTTRLIPTHIRRALIVRDKGCVFPFCDRPPGWTEAHHIQHWSKGGPTSLPNLVLLCSKHHHEVHKQEHDIETDHTGRPQIKLKHWVRE